LFKRAVRYGISDAEAFLLRPNGLRFSGAAAINGRHIVADTEAKNNTDLARREAASAASAC
jgi:hypothetical protein